MLRVAHLTTVHSALDHRIFRKECRSLAKFGYSVTVIGPHTANGLEESVRIHAIEKPKSRLSRITRSAWQVYRAAIRENAAVYHFHDPELIPIGLMLRGRGKHVIYDVHEDYPKDVYFKSYLPGVLRHLTSMIARQIEEISARHFSAVVAVTPAIADRFSRLNPNTVIVHNFPNGDELLDWKSAAWSERKCAATYIGTISPQRGIAEIVDAVGKLPASLNASLEIAGDAVPDHVTKCAAWSRVHHHGVLNQEETYRLLRNVRVGLSCQHPIPTFVDSIPVKIFEYMGAGLPIIVSDFPLWRKMLAEKGCAIFVNPLDPGKIAQAMEYLLTNSSEAEAMGRRGQAAVANHFNWNSESQKLVQLYAGMIGAPCAA